MKIKINKEKTACLTGHRPKFLPWHYREQEPSCLAFQADLEKIFVQVIHEGITTFLTGMAEGFDMLGTEILLRLRQTYPIKVIAVIPCRGQESKWRASQQLRYQKIIAQCDAKLVLADHYTPTCMQARNLYLVTHARVCVAGYNGRRVSGTGQTVHLAQAHNRQLKIINPEDYRA